MMMALFQILIVVVISGVLGMIFSRFTFLKPLKVIDCLLPIFVYLIYRLTLNTNHISKLPIILIPWLCIALIVLLHTYLTKPELNVRKYLMMIWRIGDLYFLVAWIVLIIFKIIAH